MKKNDSEQQQAKNQSIRNSDHNGLRSDIINYACDEFVRIGIKRVKMDDLSAHFSISKRTLYEMFEDKETLEVECFKHMIAKNEADIEDALLHSSNSVEACMKLFVRRLKDSEGVSQAFFKEMFRYPKLMDFLDSTSEQRSKRTLEVLKQCIDDGYLRPDLNYKMLVEAYTIQFTSIIKLGFYEKYKFTDIMNSLHLVAFRGCCTAKGLEVIDRYMKQAD